MKARAVVFEDRLEVRFREVTTPDPGPNDVVVQTRFSWISNGTEGSFLRGERGNGETPFKPGDPWPFPLVAGYQSVGVVMHVGHAVTDLRPGRWVFCALGRVEGMYEPYGGHITPKVTDRSQVWPLPEGVSPVAFSGLVLTQVGYNCGMRPPIQPGDAALVLGDGLVGHWAAQTLYTRGARILFAGRHDGRLARFRKDARCASLNVRDASLVESLRTACPGGVHVVVDTVGSLETVRALLPLMAYNGHVVSAGFNRADSLLDIQRLRFGEITLHSPSGWEKARMDATLAWVADGRLETEPLITHRFPVERAGDAWTHILEDRETTLGVILEWE